MSRRKKVSTKNFQFREINCPVCDDPSSSFLGWRGGEAHHSGAGVKTAIVRCNGCSHQYPNPMPFPVDSGLAEMYVDAEAYFRGHDTEGKKQAGLHLMREFEKKLGRKGRFLDIGCGIGETLWAAKTAGWDYEGVDPSPEFIEVGRKFLGVEGRVGLLEDAKFLENHFDAIAMSGVIEHVYDPSELFKEIDRILKPGGVIWFDAPNEDGLYMKAGNLYMRLKGKDWVVTMAPTFPPFHVQGFNPRSVRFLLKRTGFVLDDIQMFGHVWEQTGDASMRKKLENKLASAVSWFGNRINRGLYMGIWAHKPAA